MSVTSDSAFPPSATEESAADAEALARETSAETEASNDEAAADAPEARADAEDSRADGSSEDGGVPWTVGRVGELPEVVSELLPQAATVVAVRASRAVAAPTRSGWSRWFRAVLRPPVFVTRSLLRSRAGGLIAPARPRLQPIAGVRADGAANRVVSGSCEISTRFSCFARVPAAR